MSDHRSVKSVDEVNLSNLSFLGRCTIRSKVSFARNDSNIVHCRRQAAVGDHFSRISNDTQEAVVGTYTPPCALFLFLVGTVYWWYRLLSLNGRTDAHCFCSVHRGCHVPRSDDACVATSTDVTYVTPTRAPATREYRQGDFLSILERGLRFSTKRGSRIRGSFPSSENYLFGRIPSKNTGETEHLSSGSFSENLENKKRTRYANLCNIFFHIFLPIFSDGFFTLVVSKLPNGYELNIYYTYDKMLPFVNWIFMTIPRLYLRRPTLYGLSWK